MVRDFTDAQLRLVVEYVARRYLEVERGLRGKQCLRRFLTDEAYDRQSDPAASRFGNAGVVRQRDLGRIILQRPRADRVHVAVPARQQGDRWGALVMELRADDRGAWRVTELTRAQDRNLTRARPNAAWTGPGDPDLALARSAATMVAARVARTAAAERYARARHELAQVAPETPAGQLQPGDLINTATPHSQHWTKVRSISLEQATGDVNVRTVNGTTLRVPAERPVSVLTVQDNNVDGARREAAAAADRLVASAEELARWDRQLDTLDHQRARLGEGRSAGNVDQAVERPEPPSYLTRTLGPPPDDRAARRRWDAAADAVETYRDRWGITRTDCALDRRRDDSEQRADRDATVATLRELTARLAELEHERDGGRGQRLTGEHHEVGRGPFAVTIPDGRM